MTQIHFRENIPVTMIQAQASDSLVVAAARVSVMGMGSNVPGSATEHAGLINFLMKNRHGSPFEHNQFIFRVTAPIFVWREHMRHRIGFSYNEESGRYKQLDPVFYVPSDKRKLIQTGTTGSYTFIAGSQDQINMVRKSIEYANTVAYDEYERLLEAGVAKEVARMVLPVNIFSTAYVTMNARSLMNFLSLRTKSLDSTFPSFPQREIEMVAEQYESAFATQMPLTYAAFCANGRVAP